MEPLDNLQLLYFFSRSSLDVFIPEEIVTINANHCVQVLCKSSISITFLSANKSDLGLTDSTVAYL